MRNSKRAIYAGSFDPITNGHLWVIETASKLFSEVIVLVSNNPEKKGFFSYEQKEFFVKESTKHLVNVKVLSMSKQFVADFAKKEQCSYLIRGLRNTIDFEYEKTIDRVNSQINPDVQTIYLIPPAHLSEISSSTVRGLTPFPNWEPIVKTMVPQIVFDGFKEKLNTIQK